MRWLRYLIAKFHVNHRCYKMLCDDCRYCNKVKDHNSCRIETEFPELRKKSINYSLALYHIHNKMIDTKESYEKRFKESLNQCDHEFEYSHAINNNRVVLRCIKCGRYVVAKII